MKKLITTYLPTLILLTACNHSPNENSSATNTKADESGIHPGKMVKTTQRFLNIGDINNAKRSIKILLEKDSTYKDSADVIEILNTLDSIKRSNLLKEKERKKELEISFNKLRNEYDDVAQTNWYRNPYFTHYNNRNLTSLYIGKNNSSVWLRLKMSYTGDGWIFFEKAYLSYDGNTVEVEFDKYDDKETENSGGDVWEWIDVPVSDKLEDFLREFCQSKNAKMRLSGKYTETRTLTWNERQGIKDVLDGYDFLNVD